MTEAPMEVQLSMVSDPVSNAAQKKKNEYTPSPSQNDDYVVFGQLIVLGYVTFILKSSVF